MPPFTINVRVSGVPRGASAATRHRPRGILIRLLAGLLLLTVGFVAWREFEPLALFRPAPAVVLSAERKSVRISSPGIGPARTRSGFVPNVAYRYSVDGRLYFGWQYARTNMLESGAAVARRLATLHPGASITAWYDARDPSEAVLSRAPNLVLLAILTGLAALAGIVWLTAGAGRPPQADRAA